jgi:hypothetical protein
MEVKIKVQRSKPTGKSTPGTMSLNGVFECFTMEPDPVTPAIAGHPSIPAGVYPVQLTKSPHLGYITPELLAVPGRSAIRIHIANYPTELEGCTAVGQSQEQDFVGFSKNAFEALMQKLTSLQVTTITAEYVDAE